jgi:tyrosine-protein kinase Etk/Wzc
MSSTKQTDDVVGQDVDDGFDLLDVATSLASQKRVLFLIPLVATLVAVVVSLLLPVKYQAYTTLMTPVKSGGGLSSLVAGMAGGGLADLAGLAGAGGKSTDLYVGILSSRAVQGPIIDKFDLQTRYKEKFKEDVYSDLKQVVSVIPDKKSGLIRVVVEDKDPKLAADMANAYFDVLNDVLARVAVTEAQQKRLFFEKQFAKAKTDLASAEVKLKETQKTTGVLELKAQAQVAVEAAATLRAQIAQREVQLSAMRSFATEENSEYRRVLAELGGLKSELNKLEKNSPSKDSGLVSPGSLPEQGLEYVRAYREVKYQEAIFDVMAKQFEFAKLEEAKEGVEVQQLDVAVQPQRKSSPKRVIIVLSTLIVSSILAILVALVCSMYGKLKASEYGVQKIQRFKQAWAFRKRDRN